jgi:Domain of unknown function (DUF5658)
MNDDSTESQRGQADRRNRPTSPLDAFRPRGRRVRPRRSVERLGAFFTDRFDAVTLAMIVTLLSLTIVDGVLTLELLDFNSEEANPFMEYLLKRGPLAFMLGKYVLTAMGLPFLVVYMNHPLFKTRFRVGFLLPVFISLYIALISYQYMLFQAGRIDSAIGWSDAALTADSRSGMPAIKVQGNPQRRTMPSGTP